MIDLLYIIALLALAHLIADFPLQTNYIAKHKVKSDFVRVIHAVIHLWVAWFFLTFVTYSMDVTSDRVMLVSIVGGILISLFHYSIDSIQPRPRIDNDQTLHLISIIIVGILVWRLLLI